MRWGTLIALGVVALALHAPAGAGAAERPRGGAVEFQLEATNGFSILVIAGWNPQAPDGAVALSVGDGRGRASYLAPARVSETLTEVEADLGSLGHISLRAQPTGVQRTVHSSCDKRPVRYEAVDYVGEFEFHGEEGYAEASATSLPMQVKPLLDLLCSVPVEGHSGGTGIAGAGLHIGSRGTPERLKLLARTNGPRKAVVVTASIHEQRGEVEIERSVGGRFPHGVFSYDPRLTRATLEPPAPFSGRGVFRRAAAPANRWTGNLRVDFPGRSGVPVAGDRFRSDLRHGEWQFRTEVRERPRLLRPTLPAWPSTNPWPTGFARSSLLAPS